MKHLIKKHDIEINSLSYEARMSRQTINNVINSPNPKIGTVLILINAVNKLTKSSYGLVDFFGDDHPIRKAWNDE
tara:strand:+ start:80 stop:304 length:225 start_codon:yes stop_codon:yes gene_type:complete